MTKKKPGPIRKETEFADLLYENPIE